MHYKKKTCRKLSFCVDFLPDPYYNPCMPRRQCMLLVVIGLVGSLFGQSSSPAGKPDAAQQSVIYERIANYVRFEDDGAGLRESTAVIRIQSQAGVQEFGQLVFGYSAATEKLDVDYVRVRKASGQVIETPAATAQDFAPEVLREAPMYSDYRERHISVAGLQPGDVLEFHTVTHVTTALAPHEFWFESSFNKQAVIRDQILQIDVPSARLLKLKSPEYKYEVREDAGRRIYSWTIKDFTPPSRDDNENVLGFDSSDLEPDVQLSTFADWQQVAHWYAKLQGGQAKVDDAVRSKADELTRGVKDPGERTRRIYDYVARNIRYVSLSFGVGRLQPHAASEVLQNGYGDCKDKHTLVQALLRAAGVSSYPVLISSYRKLDPDVPSPAQFNHLITAVHLGGEELTWLDTTAEVAPYGLIMYQLRNKQALIASDDSYAGLRRTPADPPVKNRQEFKIDGKFSETGTFEATIEITAQGDSDWPIRASLRRVPESEWQRLMQMYPRPGGASGEISDLHVDPLEDTTRPFHLTYHYRRANYFMVPNSGIDFSILPAMPLHAGGRQDPKKPLQPLDVGPAAEVIYRAHLQFPSNYSLTAPSAVKMTRDYGEYFSSYNLTRNVLEAERRLVLKVNELPATRRADYDSFRNVAVSNANQVISCSITAPSASALAAESSVSGTPEEIRKAGAAALQRKDFATAVDLLKRAMALDATMKDGWEDLGRAYAALNDHAEAVAAFRKQIANDPFHAKANGDLAMELQQQGQFDDAIVAYRKQLEITPGDKSAQKNLGLLLAQMKRDSEARIELESAASISPNDPEIKIALSRLYARNGESEKAAALMKSVTGASTATAGTDMYASALRDDINPNQTQRDARQVLYDIGEQFDSGGYDRLGPSAFSAMTLVALAWARIGWAESLQGQTLEGLKFLDSAWTLSQSGTVGNRLARVLEKDGQRDKARHIFALAAAAGGADAEASRLALARLSSDSAAAANEMTQAGSELLQARTIKLSRIAGGTASARFGLVFDSSSKPERAEFLDGDGALRSATQQLQEKDYPVRFPDVSSVKIVREGTLNCENSQCEIVLMPPEAVSSPQPSVPPNK
jgi:tetratricopeptide (TPR) repeat protein